MLALESGWKAATANDGETGVLPHTPEGPVQGERPMPSDRNALVVHGKEGVSGSSPEEGFPAKQPFLAATALRFGSQIAPFEVHEPLESAPPAGSRRFPRSSSMTPTYVSIECPQARLAAA